MHLKKLFKAPRKTLVKACFPVMLSLSIIALAFFGGGSTAFAAGGLTLSTSYTGITVKPGEEIWMIYTADILPGKG